MLKYTKQVMKHFLNPKNVGRIKDADAIGRLENDACLLPEEKIHKNSENINISDLKENERVLTHTGKFGKIATIYTRDYKEKIIILKNKLGKISLTPEHLIYAIKVPNVDKYFRNKGKRKLIPAWYHAEQLRKNDIILYPILKEEREVENVKVNIPNFKYYPKSKRIPKKIPVNSEFLRFCGYFLAEGNIIDRPCNKKIGFSFNISEKELVDDVKKISLNLFGLEVKIKEYPERKTTVVSVYNAELAKFFKKLFGNLAEHKKIPDFIMKLPPEKQKALIFALWKGDGYVNLNRIGARAEYCTISYQLVQQIKTLLLRQKIVPSIYEDKEKKVKGVKHQKAYRIHIGQRESLIKICNILKIKYLPKSFESIDSWFNENYLYTPITDIETFFYNGKVYNLKVDNSHSFVSEAFCLHNCGDIMEVYLKIEKKKIKGREKKYIKDIKFQTLGCPVAIAASDVLCDLVKGKTLEEAEKINDKAITKKLGSLPVIKLHCSVLGSRTLKDAIEKYRKKLRNTK